MMEDRLEEAHYLELEDGSPARGSRRSRRASSLDSAYSSDGEGGAKRPSRRRRRFAAAAVLLVALAAAAAVLLVPGSPAHHSVLGSGGSSGGSGGGAAPPSAPSRPPAQADPAVLRGILADNAATERIFRMVEGRPSVALNASILGSDRNLASVLGFLGRDGVTVEAARAQLTDRNGGRPVPEGDLPLRKVVVLEGVATGFVPGFAASSAVEVHIHAHAGDVHTTVRVAPGSAAPGSAGAGSAGAAAAPGLAGAVPGAAAGGALALSNMPSAPLPKVVEHSPTVASYYGGVWVRNATLLAASHEVTDPLTLVAAPKGLTVHALADLANSTENALDVCRQIGELAPAAVDQIFQVVGHIGDDDVVHVTVASGLNFSLGAHVEVSNFTIEVVPTAHEVGVSGLVTVSPPGADPLRADVVGRAVLADEMKKVHLEGAQRGSWSLPRSAGGSVAEVEHAYASLTVELARPSRAAPKPVPGPDGTLPPAPAAAPAAVPPARPAQLAAPPSDCGGSEANRLHVCGAFGAGLRVGRVAAFGQLRVPVEAAGGGAPEGSFAFEADVDDSFRVADLPGAPGSFPELLAVKASLVASGYAGTYTFGDSADAPVASMPVVRGLNLVAHLDGNSTGLAPVRELAVGDGVLHVVARGQLATSGEFSLYAEVSGLAVGSPDVALTSANLTVASAVPHVKLGAELLLGKRLSGDHPALFSVAGSVGGKGEPLRLAGALVSPWSFPLAHRNATVRQARVSFAHHYDGTGDEFHFSGEVDAQAGDAGLVTVHADYPGETRGLLKCFAVEVREERNTTLGAALRSYGPPGADPAAHFAADAPADALHELLHSDLDSVQLYASPYCGNLSLTAEFVTESYGTATVGLVLDRDCDAAAAAADAAAPAAPAHLSLVEQDLLRVEAFERSHGVPAPGAGAGAAAPGSSPFAGADGGAAAPGAAAAAPAAPHRCGGAWQYHAFVVTTEDFDFGAARHWPGSLPDVQLREVLFVLSSEASTVAVPMLRPVRVQDPNGVNAAAPDAGRVPAVYVDTVRGLNLHALLMLNETRNLEFVRELAPVGAQDLALDASFARGGHWSACALLEDAGASSAAAPRDPSYDGVVLDARHNVTLADARLCLGSEGGLELRGDVGVPLRHTGVAGDRLLFAVEGELEHETLTLQGKVTDRNASVAVPLPHTHAKLVELEAAVRVDWTAGARKSHRVATGDVAGSLDVGSFRVDARLDVLGDAAGAGGVHLKATVKRTDNMTLGGMVVGLTGEPIDGDLPLPSSLERKVRHEWAFDELDLDLATEPFKVQAAGAMTLFGADRLDVVLQLAREAAAADGAAAGKTTWALGVELGLDALFSHVVAGARALDAMPFADMVVAVASGPAQLVFPHRAADGGKPYAAERGFNFLAELQLVNTTHHGLDAVHKWTGADRASVRGVVHDETHMELHAGVSGNMRVGGRVDVTAGGLVLRVDGPDVAVGVECDATVDVSHRAQDSLAFHGDFLVGTLGLEFDVAMTRPWVNPLGVGKGVTIDRTDLSLGVSWALAPYQVGVAGGLRIGDHGGEAQVWLTETEQMVYGELDNLTVQGIVDHMLADAGVSSPPHLVQVLTDVSLEKLKLYANTAAHELTFFNRTYEPGFLFEVDRLDLWEVVRGSAKVSFGGGRFLVDATLEPIDLLDGLLTVSGARSSEDPARFYVSLGGSEAPVVNVSGGMSLLGDRLATEIVFSPEEMVLYVDMSLLDDLFDFTLDCRSEGPPRHPTDFSVSGELNNEVQDFIAREVPKRVEEAKKDADADLEGHRAELKAKKDDLDDVNHRIAQIKAADEAKLSKEQHRLADARQDLMQAKAHVDSLQNKIHELEDKIHHLKWYKKWKAVGYGAAIAALEVAKVTADGALDLAADAVKVAQKAVSVVPDVDPRVVALEAERGLKRAAYDAASAILKAAEDVANGLLDLVEDVARAEGNVFNIEHASLSGSLRKVELGDLGKLDLKGVFAGHHVDLHVDVDFASAVTFVDAVWHDIVRIFKH